MVADKAPDQSYLRDKLALMNQRSRRMIIIDAAAPTSGALEYGNFGSQSHHFRCPRR